MKKIIVVGIAPCLEEDLEFVKHNFDFDFMLIGLDSADRVLSDIQHVASYHPDEFPLFKTRRERVG